MGTNAPDNTHRIRVADLATSQETSFAVTPDAAACQKLASELNVLALRKVRLAGSLRPVGECDWLLEATLGATFVQPCVITLDPVTTRIDEAVQRSFLAVLPPDAEGESEMPEDDGQEALAEFIDLWALMVEALALSVPDYPRVAGAEIGSLEAAAPGAEPVRNAPFAALSELRDKLDRDGQ